MTGEKPNIILLIFDALRPDFLSCYGGAAETPTLDRLAEKGTLFEQAYSVSTGTPVSHAAMFSGQYPSETGVVGQTDVPQNIPLIASWLRNYGYDTFGIRGPGRMGSEWDFDRGFNEYFESDADHPSYTSTEFLEHLLFSSKRQLLFKDFIRTATKGPDDLTSFKFDLLAKTIDDELESPFFGMVNTTIAHSPYDPPRPFKENATPELSRPPWYIFEHLLDIDEKLDRDDVRPKRVYNAQTTDGIARFLADPEYLTETELDILRAWYTASIEYLDTKLSSFLSKLNKRVLDDTILILTADHGEYFGEHGLITHSHYLYDEVLHVPLIITGSGVPSNRRDDLVSLVDLFDTICDLASIQAPEETSGISVFSGERRDAVYSEYGIGHTNRTGHRKYMSDRQLEAFGVGRKCIRTNEYFYVYTSNGEETLYRRPNEQEIDDPNEDILSDLRERLFETLGSDFESVSDDRKISDDLQENLRKLGYIE